MINILSGLFVLYAMYLTIDVRDKFSWLELFSLLYVFAAISFGIGQL